MTDVASWAPSGGSTRDVALEVLLQGPLSRTELARRLDLSQASLSRLTKPLLESGMLVETEPARDPATGRPARPLDVVPASHRFVGVKLTGDAAHAVLVDLRGTVLADASAALDDHDPARVIDTVSTLARTLAGDTAVTGLGVALGGHSPDHRSVRTAPFLGWDDVAFASQVEQSTGLPTVVENDVVALTAAEHWFGAGRGLRSLAVLTVGAGVGYGLVQHGRQVTHRDLGLGLVGHYPLDPNGAVCFEGHRGCATAMLTIPSLTGQAGVALGRPVTFAELLALARASEPVAQRLVRESVNALGRLVAAVANLTMPDRVLITGEGVALVDADPAVLRRAIARDRDPRTSPLDVVTRPGDFAQWARGAAVVAIQDFVLRAP
ncbi:ROK family transcriptional regulator [Cellulomonas cellasea]|uniref:Putative NBD/HSP70 family sugar kinase n=1 Tax=Cellulomonas cellasea TaxID=43670 RepID=A0A7W4YDM9_9CELL|nr:ROK family transcriptional regulator [Cellulomonas cellasea]MBB2924847.1 putative NBD/HSP70 family sugar kinase [Cellulomonas cellasea]